MAPLGKTRQQSTSRKVDKGARRAQTSGVRSREKARLKKARRAVV